MFQNILVTDTIGGRKLSLCNIYFLNHSQLFIASSVDLLRRNPKLVHKYETVNKNVFVKILLQCFLDFADCCD